MKVKELAEVIYPACSVFVEDPSSISEKSYLKLRSIESVLNHYGERTVDTLTTDHDYDSSYLYIILKGEE